MWCYHLQFVPHLWALVDLLEPFGVGLEGNVEVECWKGWRLDGTDWSGEGRRLPDRVNIDIGTLDSTNYVIDWHTQAFDN